MVCYDQPGFPALVPVAFADTTGSIDPAAADSSEQAMLERVDDVCAADLGVKRR